LQERIENQYGKGYDPGASEFKPLVFDWIELVNEDLRHSSDSFWKLFDRFFGVVYEMGTATVLKRN
jgi:hypothetical protein